MELLSTEGRVREVNSQKVNSGKTTREYRVKGRLVTRRRCQHAELGLADFGD
ncbi:MAG: hypothetical protein ACR2OA_01000 [Rubripirellula sp.]